MITKMTKYAFLVFHSEYIAFVEQLQKAGVVHIEQKAEGLPEDEEIAAKLKIQQEARDTLKTLKIRNVEAGEITTTLEPDEIVQKTKYLNLKLDVKKADLLQVAKEIALLQPWGKFSWSTIDKLKEAGQHIFFYTCSQSKFDQEWKEQYQLFEITLEKSINHFIIITSTPEPPVMNADLVKLPQHSLKELKEKQNTIELEVEAINQELDQLASSSHTVLQETIDQLHDEISFKSVVLTARSEAEDKLKILDGWVPEDSEQELVQWLESGGYYYVTGSPTESDDVPVKLKNNRFARLFEPIGALYALPSYNELDLTPFFAPFYWLFFGFCLGDAGYGALLVLAGGILSWKMKTLQMKRMMNLVALLGVSTILFGIITGTVFGINLYDQEWGIYGPLNQKLAQQGKSINDVMFTVAIGFGAIQILFGMLLKAFNEIRKQGWKYSIGTFGWLILLIGTVALYPFNKEEFQVLNYIQYAIWGVAGVMIFLLNSPGKGIFANIGLGLWGAYNMATGLLGDLLSYIRLFALGISSAILGYVFNMLSSQLSGSIPVLSFLIMVVILLIGHGINMFMSSLGSFVHSMRLTFVEFYKNADFEGQGKPYQPFSKK